MYASLDSACSLLETAVVWAVESNSKVASRSRTKPLKATAESCSFFASSSREAYKDSSNYSIFSTTVFNLSTSRVEATCINEAIGLDEPILAN